jgi:hypothetical protein
LGSYRAYERKGCHFTRGLIAINRTYAEVFPTSLTYNTACHEQGHVLGLNEYHNNTVSCMGSGGTITGVNISEVNNIYLGHGHTCN